MKNVFKNIIALVIIGVAIFVFRDSLLKTYFILQDKYFPCTRTITYSIGTIDTGFGINNHNSINNQFECVIENHNINFKQIYHFIMQHIKINCVTFENNLLDTTNLIYDELKILFQINDLLLSKLKLFHLTTILLQTKAIHAGGGFFYQV